MTTIHTLATPSLGDRSYVAALDGLAIAVDVQRDIDRVEAILDEHRLTLAAVVETHLHNDYLTGGLVLSRRHGAEYVVPAGPSLGYTATRARDGLSVQVGGMELRVIDTPGHTDAHAAYALHDETTDDLFAFTGGSLLLGATGRSDLLGKEIAEQLARKQYWSVRRLARLLGPEARLLPTHGFGSFCSAGAAATSGDTVADQLEANPAFLLSEDDFVSDMFSRLGDHPRYYSFMSARNAGGVDRVDLPDPPRIGAAALADAGRRQQVVVDTRAREAWAAGHLPGSLSIDATGAVNTWLGWLEPIDTPVTLMVEREVDVAPVLRQLHQIGFDRVTGVHVVEGALCPDEHGLVATTRRATFADLAAARVADPELLVLDVREANEWRQGHVRGALHVPTHGLASVFADALPRTTPWVHCAAGFRASIGVSVLERLGATSVLVDDEISFAEVKGLPWCDGVGCGDAFCAADMLVGAATSVAPDRSPI